MFLLEKLKKYQLILASHSPRRRQLLTDCDLNYALADGYEVAENFPDELPVDEVACYLSRLKSEAYPLPLGVNDILITADTTVLLHGQILGKPKDRADALRMLNRLSGHNHRVVTGVTLRSAERSDSFDSTTQVFFKVLSEEEVAYYVDTYRPYDKAGAYGIQEWIGCMAIERIDGSFYNVMGLPVQKLLTRLDAFVSV